MPCPGGIARRFTAATFLRLAAGKVAGHVVQRRLSSHSRGLRFLAGDRRTGSIHRICIYYAVATSTTLLYSRPWASSTSLPAKIDPAGISGVVSVALQTRQL